MLGGGWVKVNGSTSSPTGKRVRDKKPFPFALFPFPRPVGVLLVSLGDYIRRGTALLCLKKRIFTNW